MLTIPADHWEDLAEINWVRIENETICECCDDYVRTIDIVVYSSQIPRFLWERVAGVEEDEDCVRKFFDNRLHHSWIRSYQGDVILGHNCSICSGDMVNNKLTSPRPVWNWTNRGNHIRVRWAFPKTGLPGFPNRPATHNTILTIKSLRGFRESRTPPVVFKLACTKL